MASDLTMGQSLVRDVKAGDVSAVRKDLEQLAKKTGEKVPDINQYDLDGLALVHYAARGGNTEVFSLILLALCV